MIVRRPLGRLAALGALVGAVVVMWAAPAGAHGVGGLKPTDYQTRIVRVTPRVPGVSIRVVDLGQRLELTNTSARDVIVPGYDGEPYLRVGPRGVFENRRSPATYLNRSFTITGAPPRSADSSAPPEWVRISGGDTVRWHDHRAHFMGTTDPPSVRRDRAHAHRIDTFTLGLQTGSGPVTVTGQIWWVPPPPVWPAATGALVLAGLVVGLSRTRVWKGAVAGALGLLVVAESVHVAGQWGASTASAATKLLESAYSLAGIALAVLALVWIRRRGTDSAMPLVLIAAIFLFVAGGLADVTSLGSSQIPTTLPAWLARALVVVVLGVGGGLTVAAAWRLRPGEDHPVRARSRARPATVTS